MTTGPTPGPYWMTADNNPADGSDREVWDVGAGEECLATFNREEDALLYRASPEMLQALETAEESFENFAGAGKDDGTLGVIRRALARVKGRGDKHPSPVPKMLAVLEAALDDWPEWDDPNEPINGGDLVEWFGRWRQDAKRAVAAAKEKVE